MSDDPQPSPSTDRVRIVSPPESIPVYSCQIFVSRDESGVTGRVANLPDLQYTAASEPLVLKWLITEAKARLAKWQQLGEPIPWIDPAVAKRPDEQERLVALHL